MFCTLVWNFELVFVNKHEIFGGATPSITFCMRHRIDFATKFGSARISSFSKRAFVCVGNCSVAGL